MFRGSDVVACSIEQICKVLYIQICDDKQRMCTTSLWKRSSTSIEVLSCVAPKLSMRPGCFVCASCPHICMQAVYTWAIKIDLRNYYVYCIRNIASPSMFLIVIYYTWMQKRDCHEDEVMTHIQQHQPPERQTLQFDIFIRHYMYCGGICVHASSYWQCVS